jgi:3-oxoacyl-[acyl-carrier-protein] synthase I
MNVNNNTTNPAKKLYIAGMGMVTPVGGNVAMTAAMVAARISGYKSSDFETKAGEKITMARVPDEMIGEFKGEINEGSCFNSRHDRVTRIAILALQQACAQSTTEEAIPLILAMPEIKTDSEGLSSFVENLAKNLKPWINPAISRSIHSGRASGMEAIDFVFQYLYGTQYSYVLVGGSDSHEDLSWLMPLDRDKRLLTLGAADGFAPGEAASFLRLTPHIELAQQRNGKVIALSRPGIADEIGHLFSEEPYRGDGLDKAFKKALINQPEQSIHSIYSSMNGENHWAKEYGVAYLRNRKMFKDPVRFEHPADCYGDLGSATATTLIALAAEHLFKSSSAQAHLVYSSSDTAKRGAIVVEKCNAAVHVS